MLGALKCFEMLVKGFWVPWFCFSGDFSSLASLNKGLGFIFVPRPRKQIYGSMQEGVFFLMLLEKAFLVL